MSNICFLKAFQNKVAYESTADTTGKILPKDGKCYRILIINDNPDIVSLTTEKRLTEQACAELEKQIGYGIKIYDENDYAKYADIPIDVTIEFKDDDSYFTDNVLAYAYIPPKNGINFKGKVVFNNKFPWLDGYPRSGKELRQLGIILPNMIDNQSYATFNYRQTIKHEMCGHTFGLLHNTTEEESVMNAYYGKERIMFGATDKEILNSKYGKASFIKRAKPDSYIKAVMSREI